MYHVSCTFNLSICGAKANSLDPDEMASYSPSHLDTSCLPMADQSVSLIGRVNGSLTTSGGLLRVPVVSKDDGYNSS